LHVGNRELAQPVMPEPRFEVETHDGFVQGVRRGAPGRANGILKPVIEVGSELPGFTSYWEASDDLGLFRNELVGSLVTGLAVDIDTLCGAGARRRVEGANIAAILARPGDGPLAIAPPPSLSFCSLPGHYAASAASASS